MNPFQEDSPEFYTTRRVTFSLPFKLGSAPEVYAPGTYEVETKQQVWEASGHSGLRRTSTVLIVPTPTGSFSRQVSGTDLDRAIAEDAALSDSSS